MALDDQGSNSPFWPPYLTRVMTDMFAPRLPGEPTSEEAAPPAQA